MLNVPVASYTGKLMDIGKYAENLVYRWLQVRHGYESVDDLRDLAQARRDEIDFAVRTATGACVTIEVKSNDPGVGPLGGVLVELARTYYKADADNVFALGWFMRSKADFFVYYSQSRHAVCTVRARTLRQAFQRYAAVQRVNREMIDTRWVMSDDAKCTLICIIPWQWCERNFVIHELPEEWK